MVFSIKLPIYYKPILFYSQGQKRPDQSDRGMVHSLPAGNCEPTAQGVPYSVGSSPHVNRLTFGSAGFAS